MLIATSISVNISRRGIMTLSLQHSQPRRRTLLVSAGAMAGSQVLLPLLGCSSTSMAPESTFVLLDGSKIQTSELRGKVLLVNFWATSCTTCVKEMPELMQTHQLFHEKGLRTIAVAMSYDPPSYVLNFAQSRKLPFHVAIDNTGSIARAWNDVRVTPTTFLVDTEGRIAKNYTGAPDFAALHSHIQKLLPQKTAS